MWTLRKSINKQVICFVNPERNKDKILQIVALLLSTSRKYPAENRVNYVTGLKKRDSRRAEKKNQRSLKDFQIRKICATTSAAEYDFVDSRKSLESANFWDTKLPFEGVDFLDDYRLRKLCRPSELFFFRDKIVAIWKEGSLKINLLKYIVPCKISAHQLLKTFNSAENTYRVKIPEHDDFWDEYTIWYDTTSTLNNLDAIEYQIDKHRTHLQILEENSALGTFGSTSYVENYFEFYQEMADTPPLKYEKTMLICQGGKLQQFFKSIQIHHSFAKCNNVFRHKLHYYIELTRLLGNQVVVDYGGKIEVFGILVNIITLFCKYALSETRIDYVLFPFLLMLLGLNTFLCF